ncbi:RNA polymerase subunit sigma [Actinomadura sp. CNU-125]|uniref:SigE family RNA polymerase sigma factor n=1 Tax=Actinomadura sp. CNU-125 TaxID=1904961 RepID=UPI00095C0E8B|nr:SigE family RNA polymerase sigma factor [Actinomadura sp. CNU-125]OLT11422.1 RNA polymerase subunit sigma [Actinomadura sp. CNU-125]
MNREARESFAAFVAARSGSLIRTAYVLAGNQHAAEELLQNALAKTAARWTRVRDNPEGYVRRAMYNEQATRWRRGRRESVVAELPEPPATGPDVDLRVTLERALLALPPRKRAVLVLRYYEDLSEREVAAIMGCSVGTVRSQAHRAIARLRELAPDLAADLAPTGSRS